MGKRYIIAALSAMLMLSGCGASESSSDSSAAPAGVTQNSAESENENLPSFEELSKALSNADSDKLTGSAVYGDPQFEKNCEKLFFCPKSELSGGLIVYNQNGGFADEVSAIKRRDGDTEKALKALRGRQAMRHSDFDGYVPEELPKIDSGKVFETNGWCVLIISDSSDELEKIVRDSLK